MIQTWLIFLAKVSVCLLFFYSVYWLFLKKETFHRLSRAFLISAMCLSFVIPLIKISIPIYSATKFTQPHTVHHNRNISSSSMKRYEEPGLKSTVDQHSTSSVERTNELDTNLSINQKLRTALIGMYFGGVLGLALRLLIQLVRITDLIRKGDVITMGHLKIVNVPEDVNPCCFWNRILLNQKDLSEDDLAGIIQHEKVHVEQCHCIDNALAQILAIVLWFNPAAWLVRNALRMTHEYLADAAVCHRSDGSSYQKLLLRQLIWSASFELVHDFNLYSMRQRIVMMTRPQSPVKAGLKILWVVPVIGALLVAFAVRLETIRAREVRLSSTAEKSTVAPATHIPERVVLADMEDIFNDILTEMEHKDYMCRSYIYMRLACMRAAGWENIDYATLMPVSGYGLTFAYEAREQSGAHYSKPTGTDERIARATGFGWEWLYFDDIEQYWQALKQTIDSGRPVHAPHLEEVLFVGYQEAEKKKDRKIRPLAIPVFIDPDTWWSWRQFEKWFWEFGGRLGRFTGREETISAKDVAIDVMKTIVELAYHDSRSEDPDFDRVQWGLAGIEAFAADMADMSKKERHFCSGWFGCHDSNPQTTARQLTGRYLMNAAGLFDDPIATLIQDAAREYESAHQAWLKWDRHLGRYGPNDGWRNRNHRLAGANAAIEALKHERRAVKKINEAISQLSS